MSNKKTLSQNYEEFYEKVSVIDQQIDDEKLQLLIGLVDSNKALDILDIGCGEGRLVVSLAQKGHKVTASDISQGFLERARRLAEENSVKIDTVKCNIATDVSMFGEKKFDVIFLIDVLEHLKSPVSGLENIRGLLKDGAVLFIDTPNACSLGHFLMHVIKRQRLIDYYDSGNLGDLHFQIYDYASIEKVLNFIGLKVLRVIPTKVTLPKLSKVRKLDPFFRFLSRRFPLLSDTLLLKCKKTEPIDIDKQISHWKRISK